MKTKKPKKATKPVPQVELSIKRWRGRCGYFEVEARFVTVPRGRQVIESTCPHEHKTPAKAEQCAERMKAAMGNVVIVPYKGK